MGVTTLSLARCQIIIIPNHLWTMALADFSWKGTALSLPKNLDKSEGIIHLTCCNLPFSVTPAMTGVSLLARLTLASTPASSDMMQAFGQTLDWLEDALQVELGPGWDARRD